MLSSTGLILGGVQDPLDKSLIKGEGLGGRKDSGAALWRQKEPDTSSSCLWQLGPWAGQWSFAPKTESPQVITHGR